ncbi:TolC family protein [Mucilaginibacter pallidiroseus]|uniref:TolC family protein n=1 Tax=Mucilaginibacter pallidiroseus TaxID=2599295 RepID=A0A563UIC2_9SPHI|nr:TolC family protein [Mucilaginibacter pallidiroseus]TWR31043.1 TolC family protein [Mucilaginibacter pallidiroseus]
MNNKLKFLSILLLCFLLTTRLHAQGETFIADINYQYLEKLIATAKKNYPEVKLRQAQVNLAKSNLTQAKVLWLDAFTASYIYSPRSSLNLIQPTIFNGYQLAISVNIGQLLSKPFVVRSARETMRIAQYQQQEYDLSITANVKRLYYQYLSAQADLRLRSGAVIDGETAVKQLKYSFQKGEVTFQVYNEALTSLYLQAGYKVQAELATVTAKTNLEEVLGVRLEDVK